MYTSGKHGSSLIYVLTEKKKNRKKHTQKKLNMKFVMQK